MLASDVYAYMHSGLPIRNESKSAVLVSETPCVEPEDPAGYARKILSAAEDENMKV